MFAPTKLRTVIFVVTFSRQLTCDWISVFGFAFITMKIINFREKNMEITFIIFVFLFLCWPGSEKVSRLLSVLLYINVKYQRRKTELENYSFKNLMNFKNFKKGWKKIENVLKISKKGRK